MRMKSSKRIKLSGIITATACAVSMLAGIQSVSADTEIGGCKYTLVDNTGDGVADYARVACADTSIESANILGEVAGVEVKEIADKGFYKCANLKSVTLPDTIETVGSYAFAYDALTDISLPDSVVTVGDSAFYGCASLEGVKLSESLIKIGNNLFRGCTNLSSINIPESVKEIGNCAFLKATALSSATGANGVEKIGESAFNGTLIGDGEVLGYVGDWVVVCNTNLSEFSHEEVTIREGIVGIADRVFDNRSLNTDNLVLPNSLRIIGEGAFFNAGIKGLVLNDGLEIISDSAFEEVEITNYKLVIPESVKYVGDSAFAYNRCSQICVESECVDIGAKAFYKSTALSNVYIDGAVKTLGDEAFAECKGLTKFSCDKGTENEGVREVGNKAFYNCTLLETVDFGKYVRSIGNEVFGGTLALKSVAVDNPNCEIFDSESVFNAELKDSLYLHGYKDSTLDEYATKYEYKFGPYYTYNSETGESSYAVADEVEDPLYTTTVVTTEPVVTTTTITTSTVIDTTETEVETAPVTTSVSSTNKVTTVPVVTSTSVVTTKVATTSVTTSGVNTTGKVTSVSTTVTTVPVTSSTSVETSEVTGVETTVTDVTTTPVTTDSSTTTFARGDISKDGNIDLYDAIIIAQQLIGKNVIAEEDYDLADFNDDGKVDLYDAIGIAKKILDDIKH